MRTIALSALGAIGLAAASAPALAGEVEIKVDYSDLDLSDPVDADLLMDRIDTAVTRACSRTSIAMKYGSQAVSECKADGTAKVLSALEHKAATKVARN